MYLKFISLVTIVQIQKHFWSTYSVLGNVSSHFILKAIHLTEKETEDEREGGTNLRFYNKPTSLGRRNVVEYLFPEAKPTELDFL